MSARALALALGGALLAPVAGAQQPGATPRAGAEEQTRPGTDPWLEAWVEEAVAEAFVLPQLEDGRVSGLDPKARALLEEVLARYRRLGARRGVEAPVFAAYAGPGELARTVVGAGALTGDRLADGRYLLALGEGFEAADEALLVVTWREAGELRQRRVLLEWEEPRWTTRELRGTPPEVE